MAVIPLQQGPNHSFPVSPSFSGSIIAGQIVGLDANGNVGLGSASINPIGIAGDTISTTISGTAYSADLVISPGGASRNTENRVSDYFNETTASGLMTVYLSTGVFLIGGPNQDGIDYLDVNTWTPGMQLFTNSAGLWTDSAHKANARQVGFLAGGPPGPVESGVPGIDVNGSMALGTYIQVILQF